VGEVIEEECEDAYQNPKCPYVTVINRTNESIVATNRDVIRMQEDIGTLREDLAEIKAALLGDDLQGGLIAKVSQLWNAHKVELFLVGLIVTAFVYYIFSVPK
jgi:hypothetical protein